MEWDPYPGTLGLGCLGLNGGREGISSTPFVLGRCSVNICGCDPPTLEISWVSELSVHSIHSSFILLVTNESGSLFATPPAISAPRGNLSAPLPGTPHLGKCIWWAHNVKSGNERRIYLRWLLLRQDAKDAYPTLRYMYFTLFIWGSCCQSQFLLNSAHFPWVWSSFYFYLPSPWWRLSHL